jgi:membrane-bound ClpP family serine protease
MIKPENKLTREGAIAVAVAAVVLVIFGCVAIIADTWRPAAIGALIGFGVLLVGQVWATARGN